MKKTLFSLVISFEIPPLSGSTVIKFSDKFAYHLHITNRWLIFRQKYEFSCFMMKLFMGHCFMTKIRKNLWNSEMIGNIVLLPSSELIDPLIPFSFRFSPFFGIKCVFLLYSFMLRKKNESCKFTLVCQAIFSQYSALD